MQRVAVIGCGGAGKTTVARALARRLGLPLVDADEIVHGRGVRQEAEWRSELDAAADGERWVIDGMKLSVLEHRVERADTVVFVDVPRRWCYPGLVQRRRWRDLLNVDFLRWIWRFPGHPRRRTLAILDRHRDSTSIVVLRSRADARRYLVAVATKAGARPHYGEVTSPSRRVQRKPAQCDEAMTVP